MNPVTAPSLARRRNVSLGQELMNELATRIEQGVYRPGDKLPTEPAIMQERGVSRTVVREAISRLQAAGLVETRHGVGTFVLQPPARAGALDFTTVVHIRDVLAMLELRVSVETEAAALAAMRRTPAQLSDLEAAHQAFLDAIERDESAVEADYRFHIQIAAATGNRYFEDFHRHLGLTAIPRVQVDTAEIAHESRREYLHHVAQEHEQIVLAIRQRDPDAARASMRMHLNNNRDRLRRASEQTSAD